MSVRKQLTDYELGQFFRSLSEQLLLSFNAKLSFDSAGFLSRRLDDFERALNVLCLRLHIRVQMLANLYGKLPDAKHVPLCGLGCAQASHKSREPIVTAELLPKDQFLFRTIRLLYLPQVSMCMRLHCLISSLWMFTVRFIAIGSMDVCVSSMYYEGGK